MVYVGVDIAKVDHVIDAVDDTGNSIVKALSFKNSEAGFEKCLAWLEGIAFSPKDAVIAMEATGHYWMALYTYLIKHDYKVCVLDPMQVRAVRKFKGQVSVKNDRLDAALIAETLRIGQFSETELASEDVVSLRSLTRYSQGLKEEIAELKTKCICLLDSYFPEYASIWSDMFSQGSLAVLKKNPLPFQIAKRHLDSLAKDIAKASRSEVRGYQKAQAIKQVAKSSIGINLGEDVVAFEISSLVERIIFANEQLTKVDAKIQVLLDTLEPLILTIPGISYATGAQIVAEIGDISRFKNAAALVSYAGLNSSVNQSGKFESQSGSITKRGSSYLRRSIWLAAHVASSKDPHLNGFYLKKRCEGKPHRVAVTAVARKLCHIIYAVLRDQVPYNPELPGKDPTKHSISDSQSTTA